MNMVKRNSMAAALSLVMTVVIWGAVVLGVLNFLVLSVGLVASLNDGAISIPGGEAAADLHPLNFVFTLLSLAIIVPGIVYVCLQLRRILTTLAEGDPFVPENAPRLSRIALTLAIVEISSILIVVCMRTLIPEEEAITHPPLSFNLVVWAAVAALLILSQVFREGTRLREEERMTI